jgi:predicted ATP-grasp superfamily ATP-dependent carboligase
MADALELTEKPQAEVIYLIAGWDQWADAGAISSGLPQWLIEHTGARKIGHIRPDGFYIFQVPGTHHFLRPVVKVEDGRRVAMEGHTNDIYYAGDGHQGLVIFTGSEPHLDVERYAKAFLEMARELQVRRVAVVGGVYGEMPYDQDRSVSCVYSRPEMRNELENYALQFTTYEGGVSIGTYMAHWAEQANIELAVFYALVPAYDFSERSDTFEGLRIENDYRAWHELMRRLNHMFGLSIDCSDLEAKGRTLVSAMDEKFDELARDMPELEVKKYLSDVNDGFTAMPFMPPLDEMWDQIRDLFQDEE